MSCMECVCYCDSSDSEQSQGLTVSCCSFDLSGLYPSSVDFRIGWSCNRNLFSGWPYFLIAVCSWTVAMKPWANSFSHPCIDFQWLLKSWLGAWQSLFLINPACWTYNGLQLKTYQHQNIYSFIFQWWNNKDTKQSHVLEKAGTRNLRLINEMIVCKTKSLTNWFGTCWICWISLWEKFSRKESWLEGNVCSAHIIICVWEKLHWQQRERAKETGHRKRQTGKRDRKKERKQRRNEVKPRVL